MPKIPCGCGCGERIAPINKRGEPARFKHGHNPTPGFQAGRKGSWMSGRTGSAHPGWKGGTSYINGGYVRQVLSAEDAKNHPTARQKKTRSTWTIQRSHVVWNLAHPDDLVQPGDHVHHLNHVRDDDRVENLSKMNGAEHEAMHRREDLASGVRQRDELGRLR